MFRWLRPRTRNPLDEELLHWARHEPFTVRDLLTSVLILGRTGSGKTSSSGKLLGRAIVGHVGYMGHPRSCGLISAAKPEDVPMWQQIFADVGRSDDLLIFNVEGELRFNFLEEAARHGGTTREVSRCLMTIAETLHSGNSRSGGDEGGFWEREQERMLYNAVEVLKLGRVPIGAPQLQQFIVTGATTPQEVAEPAWRDGYHSQCIRAAYEAPKTRLEQHDAQLAFDYWLKEAPRMADRTRSSINTGVLGLLHAFNTSLVRELVSTTTNVGPHDIVEGGKWVLVDVPPARYGVLGTLINTGWKYLLQRRVLKRCAEPGDRFVVIWCDEANQFLNEFDSVYLAQCRSHLGCLVYLAQSVHSFFSAMRGERGSSQTSALLANFTYKLIHACGDAQTAEWASSLVGDSLETFYGGSSQPAEDLFDELMGYGGYSCSFSEQYEPVIRPHEFINGLRTGGPHNDHCCDAIVVRSGEPFRCGKNWLQTVFSQR